MTPGAQCYQRRWPAEFLGFAAESKGDLMDRMKQARAWLAAQPDQDLKHAARTLATSSLDGSCRLSIVASNATEACARINLALERVERSNGRRINDPRGVYGFTTNSRLPIAFLFPGDGSQYRGMFSDLCLAFPEVRIWFDLIDRASADRAPSLAPSRLIFPPHKAKPWHEDAPELWQSSGATETVFAASQGMLGLLHQIGINADAIVGHCAGDQSALLASGTLHVIDEATLIDDIRGIHSTLIGVPEGVVFAAPSGDAGIVRAAASDMGADDLFVALDNCPQQLIMWASARSAELVFNRLRAAGHSPTILPFHRAFHTRLADPAAERLLAFFETIEFVSPKIPVYSCVSAQRYPVDIHEIRKLAASVWCRPVRFRETIEAMYAGGIRVFIEVGPRGTLTGLVKSILEGREYFAIATDVPSRPGLLQLQHALALLSAAGVEMRLDRLYAHRGADLVDFEANPRGRPTPSEPVVQLNSRLPRLHVSDRTPRPHERIEGRASSRADTSETTAAVPKALGSYFETLTQLVEVEREVVVAALNRSMRSSARARSDLPFMREIMSLVPGHSAIVRCRLDSEEDLFLRDHTLGGSRLMDGSTLGGLPIVPMTVAIEMLAEIAALVLEGRRVVDIADVEMSRWLTLEQKSISLELIAARRDVNLVEVELREAGGGHMVPALRGGVIMGDALPQLERAEEFIIDEPRPSTATDARAIYSDPRMFHGPLFQSVRSVEQSGKNGIIAHLSIPASEGFFRTRPKDRLLIHPALLDGMGQVIGCWLFDNFESESVFPLRLARLRWLQDALPGTNVTCRARIHPVQGPWIEADVELVDAQGFRIATIDGWKNRRVHLSRRLYKFMLNPGRAFLATPVAAESDTGSGSARYAVAMDDLAAEVSDGGMIWLRMLVHTTLTLDERADWYRKRGDTAAKIQWLSELIAAKDAVRLLIREAEGRELRPADIEIREDGATNYTCTWAGQSRRPSIVIEPSPRGVTAVATFETSIHHDGALPGSPASSRDPSTPLPRVSRPDRG